MIHLAPFIHDLAVILAVAGLVTLVFQRIRQPVVLGYIIAGIIVGPYTPPFPLVTDIPGIKIWAELGVIFLMFTLGLDLSFRKLLRVGGSVAFTAFFEVLFMLTLGLVIGKMAGWSTIDALFLGSMLSISSTTIIVKALDELGLKTRRFAELIFGILIVEDLVAILILVALSTLAINGTLAGPLIAVSLGKLALVISSWFLAGYFLVPKFIRYVGRIRSDEMLIVLSLGLCLLLVVIAAYFNYSSALAAFIMGSILAETTESHRIEDLVKPLRDIFAAIFFVSVGMLIDPVSIWEHKELIAIIALITIVGKIFSTTLSALITGQSLKTSINVGFGLAQIGEFSFIIATLGLSLGVMSEFLYPVIVAVSVITTFATPYLIRISPRISELLDQHIPHRFSDFLDRYVAWREQQRIRKTRGADFNRRLVRWFLCGVIVTSFNVAIAKFAIPLLKKRIADPDWMFATGWILTLLISAPFIWAMLTTFWNYSGLQLREDRGEKNPHTAGLISIIVTTCWIGLLSLTYFPAKYVGMVVATLGIILFLLLYRQLEASYRWFETNFLATFSEPAQSRKLQDVYKELAPWNGHLIRLKVHANSPIVGKHLAEIELRSRYNLNVVVIQRGSKTIVAPKPDQMIYPKDELLILGTDEQVDLVRSMIEIPPEEINHPASIHRYELRSLIVGTDSALVGCRIRDSKIRETYGAMVVGLERGGKQIRNPESDVILEVDDVIWLVGESNDMSRLITDLT